jgi:protein-disulfide isomerase
LVFTRRKLHALIAVTALVAFTGSIGRTAAQEEAKVADLATPHPLGDIVLGAANAPVTMIEYASLSCGHCAAFHKDWYPAIKAEFIDTGKVRFVFREYPLDLKAAAGSMIARCIGKGDANKYHDVASTLFKTQDEWVPQDTAAQLRRIAGQFGMDEAAFTTCIANQGTVDALWAGMQFAREKLSVDSTPTFFVNDTRMKGLWSLDEFRQVIEAKLKS